MNHYDQAIRHWKNHKKDKYYQQCSYSINKEGIKSGAKITEETAKGYYVADSKNKTKLSEMFKNEDDAVDELRRLRNKNYLGYLCIISDNGIVISKE